ncbi:hypothetical protein Drorol1_Dr00026006 [Drosera rotundifolia]
MVMESRPGAFSFVLSSRAFQAMANPGLGKNVSTLGVMDVEYKRIPCDYKNQTLAVCFEDFSKQPGYLAIKILYQGGQTDITGISVVRVGTSNGASLKQNYGAVRDTSSAPAGGKFFFVIVLDSFLQQKHWESLNLSTPVCAKLNL